MAQAILLEKREEINFNLRLNTLKNVKVAWKYQAAINDIFLLIGWMSSLFINNLLTAIKLPQSQYY